MNRRLVVVYASATIGLASAIFGLMLWNSSLIVLAVALFVFSFVILKIEWIP
jgi:hypothetical protein